MKGGRRRRTDVVRRAYTCPDPACLRAVFLGREQAKAAIRQNYPGDNTLRPYKSCDGRGFHLGHLAPEVVSGEFTREDFYTPGQGT